MMDWGMLPWYVRVLVMKVQISSLPENNNPLKPNNLLYNEPQEKHKLADKWSMGTDKFAHLLKGS